MEPRTTLSKRREDDIFSSVNERPVDDISLEFFYKPHTIALLFSSIAVVIYTSFKRYVSFSIVIRSESHAFVFTLLSVLSSNKELVPR